jgi:15-cis-phytoene synthase
MAEAADPRSDDTAYLTALVREHDRPRYYATLFSPVQSRRDLFGVYGFAAEIGRIPDVVREPQLGEIRLQWWREQLASAAYAPDAGEGPAVRALAELMTRYALPAAPFDALVDARSADLYSEAPATIGDLEGWLGEMESSLFQIAAVIMGAPAASSADAAGHAGVAYGIARRLGSFAKDRARGRTIVPAELLEAEGLSPDAIFAPVPAAGVRRAVAKTANAARRHLDDALSHLAAVPARARPAFLPLSIVEPLLRRIERIGTEISQRPAALSDLETLTRIGWAKLRGGPVTLRRP